MARPPPPAGANTPGDAAVPPGLTPDQKAAHEFLAELRTRIATQPLPYRDGLETAALDSLYSLFAASRAAIKTNPGCADFARTVTDALNLCVRPTTARWHRGLDAGRLAARDGGDAFRAELAEVRLKLVRLAGTLHEMAYGTPFGDTEVHAEISEDELARLMSPLAFDFVAPLAVGPWRSAQIAPAEAQEVAARRALETAARPAYSPAEGRDAVGLALSGGGIRSATFCLGVLQTLADKGLIGDVDFLSTVSGGGFTGAFLTRRLAAAAPNADLALETGGALGPDPTPIRYVRRHAKYLMIEHLGSRWRMATAALAGLLLNWTAPLCLVAILAFAYPLLAMFASWLRVEVVVAISAAAFVVTLAAYGVMMRREERNTVVFGQAFGLALAAALVLGLDFALYDLLPKVAPLKWPSIGLAAIVAAIPTLLRFVPVVKTPAVRDTLLKLTLALAVFVIPALALAVFLELLRIDDAQVVKDLWARAPLIDRVHAPSVLAIALATGFIALFGLNINLTGPHRLYRDRIAETFVRSDDMHDVFVPLAEMGGGRAPYHLINAALNLPAETSAALRGRKCDFFLFSRRFCGSSSTGYEPTGEWSAGGRAVDVATAVAVSGAAVAPNMGLSSYPTLRAMLTLLNVRLNFWLLRPDPAPAPGWRGRLQGLAAAFNRAPGFLCLIREMTGWGMTSRRRWLCLSDGGHIENLGLYELLRRRCKFIVCVDAEQDGDYRFAGLTTVIRQAQIDFGVRIAPDLTELKPDAGTGLSRAHFAFARIDYPGAAAPGLLLYLKPSLTGDEDEMLKRFKLVHPTFPHQTTLDQFFDEECFEMYRRLGAHVAAGMFGPAIARGLTKPETVAKWFSALAVSLLEPGSFP
jgi:hypothetical protein